MKEAAGELALGKDSFTGIHKPCLEVTFASPWTDLREIITNCLENPEVDFVMLACHQGAEEGSYDATNPGCNVEGLIEPLRTRGECCIEKEMCNILVNKVDEILIFENHNRLTFSVKHDV